MIPGAPFPSVGAVNEAVNKFMKCVDQANNPLLVRRGGCARKKKSRSYRSGADGVVAHEASFRNASRNVACERPPRPLQIKWLRTIFLDVASTPPHEEGNIAYPQPI